MIFSHLFKRRKKSTNRDIIDVKRRQKAVEIELRQVEQVIAIARRRGSNR